MRFARPSRRPLAESHVAMINVVFLLLVFFVLTARIAPPDPIEVVPPVAGAQDGDAPALPDALFVGADGTLALGDARGEAALDLLRTGGGEAPLTLAADAALPAVEAAALLRRLSDLGIAEVRLVTSAGARPVPAAPEPSQ